MTRLATLLAMSVLVTAIPHAASAARCPRPCRKGLVAAAKSCRSACPERKAGKQCRAECTAALKNAMSTCKHATNPTPPACGGTSTTTTTSVTTSTAIGSSTSSTVPGGTTATLTVENYLSWCSVSIDGGATSTGSVQVEEFPLGTVVTLNGDKASSTFVFGYWLGTAGDTGPSHDTSKSTTVTMDGDRTVQACCPFASAPTTPCPPL